MLLRNFNGNSAIIFVLVEHKRLKFKKLIYFTFTKVVSDHLHQIALDTT